MTRRTDPIRRHHHPFEEDTTLSHIELRLAQVQEHQALLRSHRAADHTGPAPARSIRSTIGLSLIRLGRWVAGEGHALPAWSG